MSLLPPTASPAVRWRGSVSLEEIDALTASLQRREPWMYWREGERSWLSFGLVRWLRWESEQALDADLERYGSSPLDETPSLIVALPFPRSRGKDSPAEGSLALTVGGGHSPEAELTRGCWAIPSDPFGWRPEGVIEWSPEGTRLSLYESPMGANEGVNQRLIRWRERLSRPVGFTPIHGGEPLAAPLTLEPEESREDWDARAHAALSACEAGKLEKLVLARSGVAYPPPGHQFSLSGALEALIARSSEAEIAFALSLRRGQLFCGVSPERLLSLSGDQLSTHALAGTRARGGRSDESLAAELLTDPKELREHALVVEGLRARLARVCDELEPSLPPQLKWLPQLVHLETTMNGRLREGSSRGALLSELHPSAALAGAPKRAALEWLAAHESLERGLFASPIGALRGDGSLDLLIAIRSALIEEGQARLFAGAGVVPGSTPAGEWAETAAKLETARGLLRVEQLSGSQPHDALSSSEGRRDECL